MRARAKTHRAYCQKEYCYIMPIEQIRDRYYRTGHARNQTNAHQQFCSAKHIIIYLKLRWNEAKNKILEFHSGTHKT